MAKTPTPAPPSEQDVVRVDSFRDEHVTHRCDLRALTCDCAEWLERRSDFPEDDLRRCCEHLVFALARAPQRAPQDSPHSRARMQRLAAALQPFPLARRILPMAPPHQEEERKHAVDIFFPLEETGSPWVSVLTPKGLTRYNPAEDRWANDDTPAEGPVRQAIELRIHKALAQESAQARRPSLMEDKPAPETADIASRHEGDAQDSQSTSNDHVISHSATLNTPLSGDPVEALEQLRTSDPAPPPAAEPTAASTPRRHPPETDRHAAEDGDEETGQASASSARKRARPRFGPSADATSSQSGKPSPKTAPRSRRRFGLFAALALAAAAIATVWWVDPLQSPLPLGSGASPKQATPGASDPANPADPASASPPAADGTNAQNAAPAATPGSTPPPWDLREPLSNASLSADLLEAIRRDPDLGRYTISRRTPEGTILFGADLDLDVVFRIHLPDTGPEQRDRWIGDALQRLERASRGGSLDETS